MPLSLFVFFFSSRRRHTRYIGDWSSDVCSSDLSEAAPQPAPTRQADAPALSPAMNANITLIPKPVAVRAPAPELSHSRSEERRVGKECRCRWARDHENEKVLKTVARRGSRRIVE